jgi:hypothetical protein
VRGTIRPRISPAAPDGDEARARLVTGHAHRAGWSGVAFSGLLVLGLVLVARIPGLGASDAEYAAFYAGGGGDTLAMVGLYIVPFAGIACLWHMIATRTLLQVRRPQSWTQISHWLHLAAGVIFICMLFAGAASAGAVELVTRFSDSPPLAPDVARGLSAVGYTLVFVYGVRAAGMYMITTTGLAGSAGVLPRPVALLSYLLAAFLLVSTTFHPAILLVFPAWVLLISILLLVRRPTGVDP